MIVTLVTAPASSQLAHCAFPIHRRGHPAFHVNPLITVDSSYINCTAVVDGHRCGSPIPVTTLDDTGEPVKAPGFRAFPLTVCVRCLIHLHTTTKSPKSSDKGTKVADVGLVLLALKDNAIPIGALDLIKRPQAASFAFLQTISARTVQSKRNSHSRIRPGFVRIFPRT